MIRTSQLAAVCTAAAAILANSTAMAAIVPVSYDFGTDPGKITVGDAGFTKVTVTGTATTAVSDVANGVQMSSAGSNFGNVGFVRTFTGLGGGATNDFVITSFVTLSTVDAATNNERFGGIIMFADNAATGTGGIDTAGISAQLRGVISGTNTNDDRLELRVGTNGAILTGLPLGYDFIAGDNFLLEVKGTFSPTILTLDFSVSRNGGAAQTISTTRDLVTNAVDLDGTYFGMAGRFKPGTSSITDTFTIVPEPTSLALLGLGGLAVLRRRRGA